MNNLSKRKKILVNGYFNRNLGDDLFLKILFERYPHVDFYFYTDKVNHIIFKKYSNAKPLDFKRLEDKIFNKLGLLTKLYSIRYDCLLFIGGSIFMNNRGWEQTYKFRKKLIESFKKFNKPIYILGSNFGPYDTGFKEKYLELFRNIDDICFREKYSFNIFKELDNVRFAPDIVFNLNVKKQEKIKNSVGISMISLDIEERGSLNKYTEDFYFTMSQIIKKLLYQNKIVSLFSFCENQGDLIAINKVLKYLSDNEQEGINIYNYQTDMDLFLEVFQKHEEIIGCRFHSLILSILFNQKVYPLIYSDKTLTFLNDISTHYFYNHLSDINKLDLDTIKFNDFSNLLKDLKLRANNHFLVLDEYLK